MQSTILITIDDNPTTVTPVPGHAVLYGFDVFKIIPPSTTRFITFRAIVIAKFLCFHGQMTVSTAHAADVLRN